MRVQTVITHAPEQYLPSDGMTPCQFRFNPAKGRGTCATVGTPTVAVHVLATSLPVAPAGTHLCGYHSPYDVRTAPVSARPVLVKAGDPVSVPMVLALPMPTSSEPDAVSVFKINTVKPRSAWDMCPWCLPATPATMVADVAGTSMNERACLHHARVYGVYVPAGGVV